MQIFDKMRFFAKKKIEVNVFSFFITKINYKTQCNYCFHETFTEQKKRHRINAHLSFHEIFAFFFGIILSIVTFIIDTKLTTNNFF